VQQEESLHGMSDTRAAFSTHAEMSVTLKAAGEQLTVEEHMHTAEWGEQPTRRFFKVAQVATQSAGIRRLYK
jgi:hypothetical protein